MSFRVTVKVKSNDGGPADYIVTPINSETRDSLAFGVTDRFIQSGRIVELVGTGDAVLNRAQIMTLGATVARGIKGDKEVTVDLASLCRGGNAAVITQSFAEGALLGTYSFDRYRSTNGKSPKETGSPTLFLLVEGSANEELESSVERARIIASATALARDLVNEPPSVMTPSRFTEVASEVANRTGLEIRIWDEVDAKRERLGGLLGVASGSAQPPRMLRLHYVPQQGETSRRVALVGKGITFDSGGLSLKSGDGMMSMKIDMSGAAAVLASMSVFAELNVGVEVYGYMALTENLPSGTAQKPGDVLTTRNGKTIEVLNTDAEGRLVLADALSLAVEDGNDTIVDIATLTGACVVALGDEIAGIMGTSDELVAEVRRAGDNVGEAFWHLPVPKVYKKHIESEIADMKNIGKPGKAGTLSAALLLEEFVGTTAWAHLDIAGTAYTETSEGYLTRGATGFGVRTFVEWVTSLG